MYCEKVSSIVFNKDHYEFEENPEEAMWEDITKMLQVLIHNNQIVTFEEEDCGNLLLQFTSQKEHEWGGEYPYWVSAEDYEEYLSWKEGEDGNSSEV